MLWYGEPEFPDLNERRECDECGMFAPTHEMTRVGHDGGKTHYCRARPCQEKARQVEALHEAADRKRREHRVAAQAVDKVIGQALAKVADKQKTKMVVPEKEKARA